MRLAYLLMLHDNGNVDQVKWLISAIRHPDDHFILHIDRRASHDFRRFVREQLGGARVTYLRPRKINRFGWSVVRLELDAIETFVDLADFSYLINLSGQDYPIKSNAVIRGTLDRAYPNNFFEISSFKSIENAPLGSWDNHLRRRFAIEVFGHLFRTNLPLREPTDVSVSHKGSQWFIMSLDFAEYLLDTPLRDRVARAVKNTWGPDELFFQNFIVNSQKPVRLAGHLGREIFWTPGRSSPNTITSKDYPKLSSSHGFFARKFDCHVDRDVLVQLARDHSYPIV